MSPRAFSETDIHLALDGELPADDRADFERWLDANSEMRTRAERFAEDRARLRSALDPVLAEPMPSRLTQVLDGPPGSHAHRRALRNAVAACLIFALGAAAGYGVGSSGRSADVGAGFVAEALAAHRIYSAEKLHVVEVGADQRDHLVGWLSKRVGVTLNAPDLAGHGFGLIGGRLLPSGTTGMAAQFMYEDASGRRLSLYVTQQPQGEETGFRVEASGGTTALYWLDEGYGCVVVADLPEAELKSVAEAAYRQLLEEPHA